MLAASLAVSQSVTTWGDAKTLVLTSPIVVMLAWGGVAALIARPRAPIARAAGRATAPPRPAIARAGAALLALALAGGVLASDALQYHSSDLAPTARYDELASLSSRFAGRGPVLFTDFDEYSMYVLRDLDVGGPDFVYPPSALARLAGGYGDPVDLERAPPGALAAYPLIVTRRDPAAGRPPSAYALAWQGAYYQVWKRRPGAAAALAHVVLAGASPAVQCARIASLAPAAASDGARLIAAQSPELIPVSLARAAHPARWGHTLEGALHEGGPSRREDRQAGERQGLVMGTPGRLSASFALPASGVWDVWVQGQIMPAVRLSVDGHRIASIAGQLDGNSLVPDTVPPIRVTLAAGRHSISVTRPGFSLAPGDGGSAVLDAIFLTPASTDPQGPLRTAEPARWRTLCGRRYQWIEIVRA
jgi:hypothetical protein